MKYLVGDIGNTLVKISLLNKNFKIIKSFSFETKNIKNKKKFNFFVKKNLNDNLEKKILFSSVVPDVFKFLKYNLKKKNFKVFEVKQLNISKIIKLNIKNASQLGSDRIANSIGALSIYKKNCLVVDFGTATTFDIVKKPGTYEGGVIAPGVNLSIKTLNKFTALLPILTLKKSAKAYGKNTKEALNAGFLWGYQGLINNILKKIIFTGNTNYKVILTGGYAKLFKKYINRKSSIDENITISGIIKIYKELLT